MIRFHCDYAEGAHPLILQKMAETNEEQTVGYGNDPYCERARKKIRTLCDAPEEPRRILQSFVRFFARIKEQLRPIQVISMCMRRER